MNFAVGVSSYIGLSYIFMLELGISGVGYAWLVGNGVGCMCVGAMVWRRGGKWIRDG